MGNPDLELQNPDRAPHHHRRRRSRRDAAGGVCTAVAAGMLLAIGVWGICFDASTRSLLRLQQHCLGHPAPGSALAASGVLDAAEQCAVRSFAKDASFLDGAAAIEADELLARRNALAEVLRDEGVDAFVVEPGFTFEYYANVSRADWYPSGPESQPLLMVIQPADGCDGGIVAKTAFVAPLSAVDRLRALSIPRPSSEPSLDIVAWQPHWNPYATLRKSPLFAPVDPLAGEHTDQRPVLMVDRDTRSFVVDGLWDAGFRYKRLTPSVRQLPQSKISAAERIAGGLDSAVHAVRACLVPGQTEDGARRMLGATLASAGLTPQRLAVLFDVNGSAPQGNVLREDSMVTVEVGARHLGYSSDIVRRFSIDQADRRESREADVAEVAGGAGRGQ